MGIIKNENENFFQNIAVDSKFRSEFCIKPGDKIRGSGNHDPKPSVQSYFIY